jgi:hypothetical protein
MIPNQGQNPPNKFNQQGTFNQNPQIEQTRPSAALSQVVFN